MEREKIERRDNTLVNDRKLKIMYGFEKKGVDYERKK